MRHLLARREIEKYASKNKCFTMYEMLDYLRTKKKSYRVSTHELINILGKSKQYSLVKKGEWIWNEIDN